jgi:PTS system mannose-specific IIB component
MFWVRIDNRLVHGQVIESWLPYTKSRLIVVANDDLAEDPLRQEIMGLAIPGDIQKAFLKVENVTDFLYEKFRAQEEIDALILLADCCDAKRAYEKGLAFLRLNVGNLHYGPGKTQVCAHVALSAEDKKCLRYFKESGVKIDFRCVPNEPVQVTPTW